MTGMFAELRTRVRAQPVVFDRVRPDLLPLLRETILGFAATRPTYASTNLGGWKSDETTLDASPALRALRDTVTVEVLGGRQPFGWAMVNRNGSEHPRHRHRAAIVTGIYYVTAGDPAVPTLFEVGPPGQVMEIAIDPVPARLVLCAGETWHRVPRYDGQAPRITIVIDVRR